MDQQEFTPRNYQVALFEECLKGNTIIFLPTGAGKTFIATMVLKKMGEDLIGDDHKVSIILVNTVALVDQHVKYIKRHTPFKCGGYSGDMNVDFWSPCTWHKEFGTYQVLVMTSEIFAAIIRGNIYDLGKVNLLIFDECHHGVSDHCMRALMKPFDDLTSTPPKILGLTATLLNRNCKPNKVMEEVRALEITFRSKVATVAGLELVVGYATNPEEHFTIFNEHNTSEIETECLALIEDQREIIRLLQIEGKDGVVVDAKKVDDVLSDVLFQIRMFGIYGGKIACYVGNISCRKLSLECIDPIMNCVLKSVQTCFGQVISRFKMAMKNCPTEKERIHKFSSDKVLKLFDILREFRKISEEDLCGLVFVQRRFTASILHHVLAALGTHDPEFSYIKSDFIVGCQNRADQTLRSMYISKKNREVLNRFINKETNLLCTSEVLEEGVDIPKCTIVCKFDVPNNYRSYIQSKGRARHKKSHYYIMVPQNETEKFFQKYEAFQCIEQILNDFLVGKNDEREEPSEEEIAEMNNNDILKPFYINGPGSAYIDPISAISLLNRYCQTLQTDRYTTYSPEWTYDNVHGKTEATVILPTVCPILDPIKGLPMKNKKMAKRAAAYAACIELYLLGELNESLLPKEKCLEEVDVSYLFKHYPQEKEIGAGLGKIRLHDLQPSNATFGKIEAGHIVYLHIITLEPLFTTRDDVTNFIETDLTYGFITPNALPNTCSFPIFIKSGTINVSITNNVNTVSLSDDQINSIRQFHYVIFSEVLDVLSEFFIMDYSDSAESLFLVPVRRNTLDIDFAVLEQSREMICLEYNDEKEKLDMIVNKETYLNKVVYPTYRMDITNYLVLEVCEHLTPMSQFPNESFRDFCDYYIQKYNVALSNKQQPLLTVKALPKNKNLYKPIGSEKKRKWDENYSRDTIEYLVPELLGKREFPTELWIQGRYLPSILYRLTFILRIESLWRKIGSECGFQMKEDNMKPLKLNLGLLDYDASLEKTAVLVQRCEESERVEALPPSLISSSDLGSKLQSMEEFRYPWKDLDEPKDIERLLDVTGLDICAYCNFMKRTVSEEERKEVYNHPNPQNYLALTYNKDYKYKTIRLLFEKNNGIVELADIYEAMTSKHANDIVNLERLETLGDSFLKFITSHYISLKFPQFNEGRATQLKGRMISNKNLFYLASKYNIGGIIRNKGLREKNGWMPPGFCIPEKIRSDICNKVMSWKILNCLTFTKDEVLSGVPRLEDFDMDWNEYSEDNTDDSYNDTDQYLKKQFLKDKCVADAVEALFGTYLLNTGYDGCLKVVQWMGVIPNTENMKALMEKPVPSPTLLPDIGITEIKAHLPFYAEIEKILGYQFNNRAFLLQAFTHPSYTPNRLTLSYEKLEFLGDAILDFLVTCFIFEKCGDMTPGDLTDLRSSLVNNNTFASFIVRLGLHKYMLLMNSKLQHYIDNFVEFFTTKKDFVIDDEILILLEEDDLKLAEYVDVPKALGDLFEAIAGAIFLDSNYSLEQVWKVFYPFMWKEIDLFSGNVPKNVVRRLHEQEGAYPEFGPAVDTGNGKVMVKLNFLAEGRPKFVHGFGSNKIMAKRAAAKIALRNMQ